MDPGRDGSEPPAKRQRGAAAAPREEVASQGQSSPLARHELDESPARSAPIDRVFGGRSVFGDAAFGLFDAPTRTTPPPTPAAAARAQTVTPEPGACAAAPSPCKPVAHRYGAAQALVNRLWGDAGGTRGDG